MQTPRDAASGEVTLRTIARVQRRLALQSLLDAVIAAALLAAAAVWGARVLGSPAPAAALLIGAAAVALAGSWLRARRRPCRGRAAAARVEQGLPESHNLVITAQELLENPERGAPWMRTRVLSDADRIMAGVAAREIVPLRGRLALLVPAAAALLAALYASSPGARILPANGAPDAIPGDGNGKRIVVTLTPPAHTGLPEQTLTDPDRIRAVEGTLARLTMPAAGSSVRFDGTALRARRDPGDSLVSVELTLVESGYFAVEGVRPARALIPVVVVPDRAPSIRVEHPGRDLLVPNAERRVSVRAVATDDFGLALLSLRYTKVSGSGEQYEFTEGEAPFEVAKGDPRSWRGSGVLALERLGLQPGDSLVYRVVARDARAGPRGHSTSETFFIEVAGPGQIALEGFEMPPERERYALSQQMIVLKIERLRAREKQLARERREKETAAIAAEQRAVKGNFVFLTGGHVENEEEEAEGSHEIQEGRLENTARREITTAIAHMTRVEQALASLDTAAALSQARLAVDALQRAFGRNRYILRTLPVRSRIDPARRLTGRLDEAAGSTRNLEPGPGGARAEAVEALLSRMVAAHRRISGRPDSGAPSAEELLERALSIDPVNPEWQTIVSHLAAFADASSGTARNTSEALRRLRAAMSLVFAQARSISRRQSVPVPAPDMLRGTWAEERRSR